ncbi:MAG: OmpA family protein [Daejeonella sp.]|uniref:OmpA family protein n=1 Tax=Daejeonella sp. TaxID=2805397 RepID=UPI002736006E|nr:OmpA family protein [Daejeonella sp.]MDP3468455.1 OmpA family protein [Daejeonella sp.]
MKTKLFIAVLTLSTSIIINNVFAQVSGSANYMAVNNSTLVSHDSLLEPGNTISTRTANEVDAVLYRKAMYMVSEQFVFDNLSSLKKAFAIADIYFDLDDASIRPDALPVLNNLVILMKENPGINVATTAYSDSRMSKYNEKLAANRAQSAINYLISQGISADRLQIEKYGRPNMGNPCNDDPSCSLAVQQLNRKTEFNIVFNGINLGHVN